MAITYDSSSHSIYKSRRIATLKHRATPYRGEWVIDAADNLEYIARHEVESSPGRRKTVETVALKSLAEAQTFSGYLGAYGWIKVWDL